MSLKVINLNRLSYHKALDIQQKLFQKVKEAETESNKQRNYLLLVEHEPVYTVGIRSREYVDSDLQQKLKKIGSDFVVTNRGGLITFHGIGQLVAYPIINLKNFPVTQRSIKKFVCLLESVIIDVCKDFSIEACRLESYPGVWVDDNRKIAALGIHASKYITMHGVAINCNIDLNWFNHIVPCGIPDKETTSISKELNKDISIDHVSNLFVDHFKKTLQCHD